MINCNVILAPVDFSAPSKAAFEKACEYADQFGAALHVLHVRQLSRREAEFGGDSVVKCFDRIVEESTDQMRIFLGDTADHCFPIEPVFRAGRPAEEIVKYADDISANLIVIGTHGHSGLTHIVMGSVAEEVVRTARCDVLAVHQRDNGRFEFTALREPAAK